MLDWLVELFNGFGSKLMDVLPHSPFSQFIKQISMNANIGYINWFIPIHTMLIMLNAWLGAIAIYYAYMIIARWIKLLD